MGTIHAASVEKSDRLRRVADVLSDGQQHSTMDIVVQANCCAVNSVISELRANGMTIECRRRGALWYYRLSPDLGKS